MKNKEHELNMDEVFHPDTEKFIDSRIIPVFGCDIPLPPIVDNKVDIVNIGGDPVGAIMGKIEEMDGNIIKKFKLEAVSIINKKL